MFCGCQRETPYGAVFTRHNTKSQNERIEATSFPAPSRTHIAHDDALDHVRFHPTVIGQHQRAVPCVSGSFGWQQRTPSVTTATSPGKIIRRSSASVARFLCPLLLGKPPPRGAPDVLRRRCFVPTISLVRISSPLFNGREPSTAGCRRLDVAARRAFPVYFHRCIAVANAIAEGLRYFLVGKVETSLLPTVTISTIVGFLLAACRRPEGPWEQRGRVVANPWLQCVQATAVTTATRMQGRRGSAPANSKRGVKPELSLCITVPSGSFAFGRKATINPVECSSRVKLQQFFYAQCCQTLLVFDASDVACSSLTFGQKSGDSGVCCCCVCPPRHLPCSRRFRSSSFLPDEPAAPLLHRSGHAFRTRVSLFFLCAHCHPENA